MSHISTICIIFIALQIHKWAWGINTEEIALWKYLIGASVYLVFMLLGILAQRNYGGPE